MKIVIANSIGIDKNGCYMIHSPSRWSEGVKNKYHWFAYYPWELAYLSSLLKKETKHRVKFLDGCLERLNFPAYYKRILQEKPDFLIMESATILIEENLALCLLIKKILHTKLIFVGQHASVFSAQLLDAGVDYVCIGEYEYSVLEIIQGKKQKDILGLYPNKRRKLLNINSLSWPEDNDVSRIAYGMPGEPSSEYLEVQMYASRGCMMSCNFCVASNVYYRQPNWRAREVKDIVNEIKYLKKKYPQMQGIFFDEECHTGEKKFILDLSKAIIASGLNNLHYEAMCDLRFLDADVLQAIKDAGYYKIRVGIETKSSKVMSGIGKFIDLNLIYQKLALAKKNGLKTYGTFTFGALGSDSREDKQTIKLIKELISAGLLDNLQLSICTPQPGTPFYETVKQSNFLRKNLSFRDYDGGNFALVDYPNYNHQAIEKMKRKALLVRDHYFLRAKLQNKNFWQWISSIYQRYGIKGLLIKAVIRFLSEVKYQAGKWFV
ncbi:MAG: radical SAM protein [Candidatus Omnitrophota bacterium]|nr:MAG: radical SAM protein [Candidatus Omnitrophota bacterium]